MDPTEDELNGMSTLDDVGNWAGTAGQIQTALTAALGGPTKLRDIAFISRPDWDSAVSGLKVTVTAADGTPSERELTLVDKSRIEIFRRTVFLRLGARPDSPGASGPQVLPEPVKVVAAGWQTRRPLASSSVVDPTLDAEIVQLSHEEVTKMYSDYKAKFGDYPSLDVEPTMDQLAAISQLVKSNSLPYVDFSVFGPHGLRQLRRAVFTSYTLNAATGEWSKKETPGPDSIQAWERCFKTYRVSLLLLGVVDSERLESYMEFIKDLHSQFGHDCWGIIYRADVRMRTEFMDRIRRSLHESPQFGYTKAALWSAVFAMAIREAEFWSKEVKTPATLLLARNKSLPAREDSDSSDGGPKLGAKVRKKGKAKYRGQAYSEISASQEKAYKCCDCFLPKSQSWTAFRYGATNIDPQQWAGQPRALLLFSGRHDLSCQLASDGWGVVVADPEGPIPVDLLDGKVRKAILADVTKGFFDAPPWESSSPFEENPERAQLKDANSLVELTAAVAQEQLNHLRAFWIENPDRGEKLDIWKTSWLQPLLKNALVTTANFDQCRFGAEVTRPTKLAEYGHDFMDVMGLRCNHSSSREWTRPDGSKYYAKHDSFGQSWRETSAGKRQRVSQTLAEYPAELNKRIAKGMLATDGHRVAKLRSGTSH
ncbi:unnamed protein product [Effrenium voratum]|nr:unnamed protein product [Effrenium voratum]